jgi:uncharacterized protein
METPCINICHLDAVTGLCDGCGRTGAEIAAWASLTPARRREIMRELPERLMRPAAPGKAEASQ